MTRVGSARLWIWTRRAARPAPRSRRPCSAPRPPGPGPASSKSSYADRSRRSETRTPASIPAAASAAQARAPGRCWAARAANGAPAANAAAGRTRQRVGHRVEERPHQGLGLGEPERTQTGHRDGVRLGRHGGGDRPQLRDVVGVERAGPPGVVVGRGETGQQPAAGRQVQGVQRGGAPAGRGGVRRLVLPGPDQQRHRVGDGHQQGRDEPGTDAAAVHPHHRDLTGPDPGRRLVRRLRRNRFRRRPRPDHSRRPRRPQRRPCPRGARIQGRPLQRLGAGEPCRRRQFSGRRPEGDPPVPGQGGGQEDRGTAGERPGDRVCRTRFGTAEHVRCHVAPSRPWIRLPLRV